jgi:hypothetical protein
MSDEVPSTVAVCLAARHGASFLSSLQIPRQLAAHTEDEMGRLAHTMEGDVDLEASLWRCLSPEHPPPHEHSAHEVVNELEPLNGLGPASMSRPLRGSLG